MRKEHHMKEPLRSLCKCPVENGDTTPTSTDNSNTSSALRLSERIRSQRTRKIYQGQPRRLVILGATFTTAKLYFEQVGQPSYYNVVLTTNNSADKNTTNERHTYQFTYTQYIHYGNYLLVTGLTPNTVYTVELYVTYESGDVFPVNHTKQFRTSVAEGAVKDVVLKNPTNQIFPVESGDVDSQRTGFTLEFTPLRDRVDYRISIPDLLYIANISYDTMTNEYPLLYSKSFDASYNTTYTAIVETLYGSGGDQYTFDTSASVTTVNENYFLQSNLTVDTIFNRSILLSYSPVDTIEGIHHNFYVNGVKHGNIELLNNNRVTILDLMINTTYTLAISTVFPDSHNEYIDNVNKLTLTTLNESGVTFLYNENSPIIRNTSVDFLYEAPSGTSFTVIPSIEPNHGTIHLDSVNQILSITGLSINTTYLVSLDASYGSTNNNYSVQEYFTTLNQGPVTNLQVTEIVKVRSDAIVTFTGAPSESSLSMKPYYLVQFGDNPEITLQYNANTSTKGVKFTELSNIVYEYSVKSVYPPITTVEPTIPSYTYTVSGDIEIQTTSVGNLNPLFSVRGDSINIIKYAATGFTNHTYYSVRFDEVISDGTNTTREAYFQDRIYDWDVSLLIPDLLPDTSYNYRIEGYYDFDDFSSNNVGTLRTLNESKTTITNMTIGVNSVSITTSNRTGNGSTLSMKFNLNENVEQNFSSVTTFMKNDLLANTFYQLQITNRYNLYDYNYDTGFTTLHAGPGTLNGLFVFDHPVYGNSAILSIDNINPNEVNYNIVELQYTDGTPDISYVVSTNETIQIPNMVFNQDIRATLHTYYRDKISTGLIDFQYELPYYSTSEYNFQAVMPEFISIVKNDSIELRWLDLDPTVDISYFIQCVESGSGSPPTETILDNNTDHFTIMNLERNTDYDISFTRLYLNFSNTSKISAGSATGNYNNRTWSQMQYGDFTDGTYNVITSVTFGDLSNRAAEVLLIENSDRTYIPLNTVNYNSDGTNKQIINTIVNGSNYYGDYAQVTMPYKIVLKEIYVRGKYDSNWPSWNWDFGRKLMPKKVFIFGSNDNGTTFTFLKEDEIPFTTDLTNISSKAVSGITEAYSTIRIVVNSTWGYGQVLVNHLRFIGDVLPPNTQFKSLRTLNEGPVDTLANSIVLNTGMGGNTLVLDLENSISTPNIVENRFVFDNAPDATISTSQTNIIDVTLPDGSAEGDTLSGTIRTIYKPTPIQLTSPYVLYSTPVDGYISDSLTFTVEQMKTPTVLLNGTLDPSNGETYVFSDTTGMTSTSSTVYPEHYNTNAVLLVDNSNGTLYGHNYLDRAHVNQHALFYVDYPVSQPAFLEQSISGEYLFQNYYSLAFFIAKHLAENNPYGNISELPYRGSGTTSSTVEYKAQLVDNHGVLFQTNPLISYDQSWNQIQVKFYLANSSKNVKLRIQRNYYELNHLLLSDISMVAMGAEFQPVPSIRHNVDTWNTTSFGTSVDISWNQFYGESILQLSTNMSLGFWLYVHPLTQNLTETVFLLVGDSTATVHQDNVLSFYIKKNRIYIENQSHSYAFKRHSIYNAYREKIPIYYQVVYTNGDVIVYENGHRLQQYKPDTFLKEAVRTQNIYLGEPSLSSERFGPIVRDVCFYNFPFTDKQVLNVYNDLRAPYSSFGNYTDILPDEKFNINTSANANTMTFINSTVHYELHNGTRLQKVLSFTPMEGQIVEWDASMTLPFSIGFWYKPDPKIRTVDETLVSLDSSTGESLVMLRQNGSSLHFSGTIFTNKTVPWRPPIKSVEHILCTVNSNGEIELYKNGYLYYSNAITTTPITPDESPTQLDISSIELGSPQYRSQLADLQIFSKALDQAEVFTAYMNYYRIMVQYNIATGIYTVQIPQVAGSEVNATVNYTITNTTISSFNVPIQGTITLVDDDLTNFDISMSSFERNQLHKNNDSFQLTIEDYGISTVIQGGANPYIDAVYVTNSYVEEGGTITITLNNVPVSDPIVQYPYELRGLGITEKDISGESLTGILEPNSSTDIIVRKDYKTEDQESLIIAIDSLFISTVVDISDTTVNLLSIDNDKPKNGETFVITLTWPEPTTLPDVINYELVNDQNGLSNDVLPNIGTFRKIFNNTDNEYKYSIQFTVSNNARTQERVTMKLVNYDSTIEIVLNDFIEPRIRLHKLNEPNTDVINEGETFVVIMELPLTWNSQSDFSYNIGTANSGGLAKFNREDISTNNDPSFDLTAMSGQFSFDLATNIRDISYNFVTTTNRVPEQDEEIIVQLTSDGYTDISSNILTIINSAKAPRYSLEISGLTKNTGESFYSVNEGDIFSITLIGVNALIESAQYRISGITLADISVDVGTLSQNDSGDIVSTMNIQETKTFTINLDESTETDEMFTFTIDELTLSETFKIVDTSVAPAYGLASYTDGNTIIIRFTNTNFSLMTESQKSMLLSYQLSGDLVIVEQPVKDQDIYFQIKESDSIDVTYTYTGTGTLNVRAFGLETSETITD